MEPKSNGKIKKIILYGIGIVFVGILGLLVLSPCIKHILEVEKNPTEETNTIDVTVRSEWPDSIAHCYVYMITSAKVDTQEQQVNSCYTTININHASGDEKSFTVYGMGYAPLSEQEILDLAMRVPKPQQSQLSFKKQKTKKEVDTIVDTFTYPIIPEIEGNRINLWDFVFLPVVFVDVTFKGYYSLLIQRNEEPSLSGEEYGKKRPLRYFDVYGITPQGFKKVDFEPYDQFKTATHSWMLGRGTIIDYQKKQIIIPYLGENSCSDHGTFIDEIYTYDPKSDSFKHRTKRRPYECDD